MADIALDLCESDQEQGRARRVCEWGWLGSFIGCVQLGLPLPDVHVVHVLGLAMVHVASTPWLPMATTRSFGTFSQEKTRLLWEAHWWPSLNGIQW